MSLDQELDFAAVDYHARAASLARRFAPALVHFHAEWRDLIATLADEGSEPNLLAQLAGRSRRRVRPLSPDRRVLLGVCGPGAVGKDACEARLARTPARPRKVLASTTRAPRPGEAEGKAYNFLSEAEFDAAERAGEFLFVAHREGRGRYGLTERALHAGLDRTRICMVQESPHNLSLIRRRIHFDFPNVDTLLLYLMPPAPMFAHLVLRFFTRACDDEALLGDEAALEAAAISTLGSRQIREFRSALDLFECGQPFVFVANGSLNAVVATCEELLALDQPPPAEPRRRTRSRAIVGHGAETFHAAP